MLYKIKYFKRKMFSLLFIIILSCSMLLGASWENKESGFVNFHKLISENEIKVLGDKAVMTQFEIEGLINTINNEKAFLTECKDKYLMDKEITLSAEEIVAFHYFSLSPKEQVRFLEVSQGNTVDVEVKNDDILISYNVNTIS